jgi:hypothetical protein
VWRERLQRGDGGERHEKRPRVDRVGRADPDLTDEQAGEGRADDLTDLEQELPQRVGGRELAALDEVGDYGRPRRGIRGAKARARGGQHVQRPQVRVPVRRIPQQAQAATSQQALRDEQQATPVHGIGERAPRQGAPEHRSDLSQSDQPDVERGVGQAEHLIRDGDDRQLRPEDAHDVAAP